MDAQIARDLDDGSGSMPSHAHVSLAESHLTSCGINGFLHRTAEDRKDLL